MKLTNKYSLKENTYYFIYYVTCGQYTGMLKESAFLHIKNRIDREDRSMSFDSILFMRSSGYPDEDFVWNIDDKIKSMSYYELSKEEIEDIIIKTI